jgi:hypothetical protein
MRSYREQFDHETADRIEALIQRLESLSYPSGPSRYYGLDLAACLAAGALAGSLVVASSFMELYVRGLVVHYAENAQRGWSRPVEIERELDDMKATGFKQLVDHLADYGLFDPDAAEEAKAIYDNVRIPAHHGLPSRLIGRPDESLMVAIFGKVGRATPVSMTEFEDFIELEALPIIEKIVGVLERSQYGKFA